MSRMSPENPLNSNKLLNVFPREVKISFNNRYPYDVKPNVTYENIREMRENYFKQGLLNVERMKKLANRPKSMDYFDKIMLDRSDRVQEIKQFKAQGGKVVGVFCIQVPDELIYAAGAVPIRLSCGFYDAISPAEEIVPKNTCPQIKAAVGFNILRINPLFEFCDVIVVPTTCDGKKKMADILSNYHHTWTMELPNDKDNPDSRAFWVNQVRLLKEKLEHLTGRKITKSALRNSIKMLHMRTAVSRELSEIRKNRSITISGRDAYTILQTAFFDDPQRWIKQVEAVTEELKHNLQNNIDIASPDTPRIVMTGAPLIWPNMKVLHTIEESGGVVVADDSCACGQYFYNPVELNDWSMKAMIEGISDKGLLPAVCPIFLHSDDRIDRILELVDQYNADGAVYHVLRLCQVFDFEYTKVSRVLEKRSIPLLRIETEYSQEDVGQIKTRIEAFVEMLEARR